MTEEEWNSWEMNKAGALMNAAPKPSFAKRLEYLEADGSAQRTAILKLEKVMKITCRALWALWVMCVALAVAVLT